MTKDELIALAREGKARIEVAYTITRYCITQDGVDDNGARSFAPAIFMSIRGEDGSVDDSDYSYFTDGDQTDLTDDEIDTLRVAIEKQRVAIRKHYRGH